MNTDVGYMVPFGEERGDGRGTLESNVALGYQLLDWLQSEVELGYAHDFVCKDDDADVLAATAGLIMPLSGYLRVALGARRIIAGRNADQATEAMLSLTVMW